MNRIKYFRPTLKYYSSDFQKTSPYVRRIWIIDNDQNLYGHILPVWIFVFRRNNISSPSRTEFFINFYVFIKPGFFFVYIKTAIDVMNLFRWRRISERSDRLCFIRGMSNNPSVVSGTEVFVFSYFPGNFNATNQPPCSRSQYYTNAVPTKPLNLKYKCIHKTRTNGCTMTVFTVYRI